MSDQESFMSRWSRRKREAVEDDLLRNRETPDAPTKTDAAAAKSETESKSQAEPPPFDPATLPPIDSIDAATDLRAFLKPGVPSALTGAALRRAWAADPAIRDFIGLSENAWDFTDPNAIPGFGPLEMTDELRKVIAQAMGGAQDLVDPAAGEPTPSVPAGREQAALSLGNSPQSAPPDENTGKAADQDQRESRQELPPGQQSLLQDSKDNIAAQHIEITPEYT